jgi:hypothetical protein
MLCYFRIFHFGIPALICMPYAYDKTWENNFFAKNSPKNVCQVVPKHIKDILTNKNFLNTNIKVFAANIFKIRRYYRYYICFIIKQPSL